MVSKPTEKNAKSKKEMVVGNSSRRMNPYILAATIALFIVAAGAAYSVWTAPNNLQATVQAAPAKPPEVGNQTVVYPLSLFNDGKARHFKYTYNGSVIRYFILKSSDGVVRAAFDACDVCWQTDKGYSQSGDDMVCNSCNRRFASTRINEVQGGCNPAPLTRSVENDQLVIRVADILTGSVYFDFKGRT